MNKSDVFLIIAQIYIAGSFVVQKNKVSLLLFSTIWLILSLIAWVKL
jgi:hypothetical protein